MTSLVLAATVLFGASVAGASPYGTSSGGPGYFPDSTDHWYCFDSSVPSWDFGRFHTAMADLDHQVILYDVFTSTCGSSTDVKAVYETPIYDFPGAWGANICWSWVNFPNRICDHFFTKVDPSQMWWDLVYYEGYSQEYFSAILDWVIRHEIGHSTGMGHSSGQHQMAPGPVRPGLDWWWFFYTPHDQCHVNHRFGGSMC